MDLSLSSLDRWTTTPTWMHSRGWTKKDHSISICWLCLWWLFECLYFKILRFLLSTLLIPSGLLMQNLSLACAPLDGSSISQNLLSQPLDAHPRAIYFLSQFYFSPGKSKVTTLLTSPDPRGFPRQCRHCIILLLQWERGGEKWKRVGR